MRQIGNHYSDNAKYKTKYNESNVDSIFEAQQNCDEYWKYIRLYHLFFLLIKELYNIHEINQK